MTLLPFGLCEAAFWVGSSALRRSSHEAGVHLCGEEGPLEVHVEELLVGIDRDVFKLNRVEDGSVEHEDIDLARLSTVCLQSGAGQRCGRHLP